MRSALSIAVAVLFSLSCWMFLVAEEALGITTDPHPNPYLHEAIGTTVWLSQPFAILEHLALYSGYHPSALDYSSHRLWLAGLTILSAAALSFALLRLQRFATVHLVVAAAIAIFSIVTAFQSVRDYRFAQRWYEKYGY
jgi:hypothetical protein